MIVGAIFSDFSLGVSWYYESMCTTFGRSSDYSKFVIGRPRITEAITQSTEERGRLRLYSVRLSECFPPLNVCLRGRQGQDRSQIDRQALAGRLRLSLHYAASARAYHPNAWRKFHVKNELIEFGSSSRRHMHILLSKID